MIKGRMHRVVLGEGMEKERLRTVERENEEGGRCGGAKFVTAAMLCFSLACSH